MNKIQWKKLYREERLLKKEIWKDIQGYEGFYQVSNLGRVKSLIFGKEKIIKPGKTKALYYTVNLKGKSHYLHRLIAFSFIKKNEYENCVNHKNGIRNDNRISNLEWCTYSGNLIHSYLELGRQKKNNQVGRFGKFHNASKKVLKYTKEGIFIKEYGSIVDAGNEVGIDRSSISQCCRLKQKTAGGFIWKYKE